MSCVVYGMICACGGDIWYVGGVWCICVRYLVFVYVFIVRGVCVLFHICVWYMVWATCVKRKIKREEKEGKKEMIWGYMMRCVYDTWCDVCIIYGMRYVCERDGVGA